MSEFKIVAVKLIKKGEKLELTLDEADISPAELERKGLNKCHPDLIASVQALRPHLAILCSYCAEKDVLKYKDLDKFTVTGYSIGGKEDTPGFTITGYRQTYRGGTLSLNTPFTLFEEKDDSRYALVGDVEAKIKAINTEVVKYVREGKKAQEGDPNQAAMDFKDTGDGDPGEQKKGKGGKVTSMKIAGKEEKPLFKDGDPSAYPNIPAADADAMERIRQDDKSHGRR